MEDHEVQDSACHAFTGGETYDELLRRITEWWGPLEEKWPTSVITAIIFDEAKDEDTRGAEVYYSPSI